MTRGVCADPIKNMERLKKISDANKGRHPSEETRKKISDAKKGVLNPMFGKHPSEETLSKMREGHRLRNLSEEYRKKLSETHKGRKITEETRNKISVANKGRPMAEETRRGLSEAIKGRILTEDHRRKIGEANEGKNNPSWKGGISFEPYCPKFNRVFKERVRAFFGHRCVECGAVQNKTKLPVHHVNFDKKTCCNDSTPLFVPLCQSCHGKTQRNRIFWEYWFTEMINYLYGGKCYVEKGVG